MNRFVTPVAAVALVLGLQACNQQQSGGDSPAGSEPVALDTPNKRLSYGVALGLGRNMKNDGMEMDIDAFALGLRDAFTGAEQRLTPEEIQAEQEANQQALATANAEAAETFMAENGAREEVTVTESGLQYEVIEAGEGPVPGPGDSVEVHYRGTLLDGTEFDSSYKRGQPVTFGVDQVIAGWTEALQLMPVGSKWKLYIPPELAYGAGGAGNVIGPNAALTFEVELLSIPSQAEAASGEDASAEG
jgi:FKBP-type peptidyl-prolyl cis-trans isomerase